EADDVHVRRAVQAVRVHEEEELSLHVGSVVQHDLEVLDQALLVSGATQLELALRDVALLLRPHGLEVERPELALRAEAEVARGDALRDEARGGQPDRDVADLEALEDLVLEALVVDVDVVRRVELAPLVVIHVDVDALRDRAGHADPELDVRLELREQAGVAVELEAAQARLGPRPASAQLDAPADHHAQNGVIAHHAGPARALAS